MLNDHLSLLLKQVEALMSNEPDFIANAANISSLLYHNLEQVNWVGFYILRDEELVLGPFSGQPACTRIPLGKGVCGTAYSKQETVIVEDVHAFEGHIACDAASESEIVIPFNNNTYQGVFDIDSPIQGRFGVSEKALFEGVVALFNEL